MPNASSPAPDAPERPADRTLLDALPAALAAGGALPLAFSLVRARETPVAQMRWDSSEAYRARIFNCLPAWKPISRCFGEEP